jgi:hypothetical protein
MANKLMILLVFFCQNFSGGSGHRYKAVVFLFLPLISVMGFFINAFTLPDEQLRGYSLLDNISNNLFGNV